MALASENYIGEQFKNWVVTKCPPIGSTPQETTATYFAGVVAFVFVMLSSFGGRPGKRVRRSS
jgi:hypothetical protein